ncbi:hypothetical protein GQ42DRAFT_160584 [Ramicandelaber brevisporus]|nr:hypothetical protein GQ42DRAFT_160584 [Ramicandelaber brevisporus]
MKTAHFVAVAVLFAAAVSGAPGSDSSPTVPAAVKPDSAPVVAKIGYCDCWDHINYPCIPITQCALEGHKCAGPC